ncbi:MAG TPA: efflux RND transporter periplasmic adaptor subunit [Planctomycetota bacterium]|nr:efflux RND transporter periplasmic adaptor subunit [Planctomycetota bacterium]
MKRSLLAPLLLLGTVVVVGAALAAWKKSSLDAADAAAASQPEPSEVVTVALARSRDNVRTMTSIGTVLALRSVTLSNELAGTVRQVTLEPGAVVEEGTVLVALDVGVEQAELAAKEAQAKLAETTFGRLERASAAHGASEMDVDRARAERDIALADVARYRAIIERKTIRAPFRARVGLSDVHPGQYLKEGTELTTLQGMDDAVYVDFTIPQEIAAGLRTGDVVQVQRGDPGGSAAGAFAPATLVAVDARVEIATRNAWVRARLEGGADMPAPGSSVRVSVPVGAPRSSVTVPVSALRKGPQGDHVFVVGPDESGASRARVRAVHSGIVLGDDVVIEEGLAAGEQVAASGSFKLRDAVLVSVAEPESAAGTAPAEGSAP